MKEQKKPTWLRYLLSMYGGILGGLLILALLTWYQKQQILELERRVNEVAVEQEKSIRAVKEFLDWHEGLEHEFEEADPARGGQI